MVSNESHHGWIHLNIKITLKKTKSTLANSLQRPLEELGSSRVVEMVPVKGGIGSIWAPPEGKDYKWYISGIFPANWGMDYATDPTFYGNQKQPLIWGLKFWCCLAMMVGQSNPYPQLLPWQRAKDHEHKTPNPNWKSKPHRRYRWLGFANVWCLEKVPNIFSKMVGFSWWFTMVQSVKNNLKNKSKLIFTLEATLSAPPFPHRWHTLGTVGTCPIYV